MAEGRKSYSNTLEFLFQVGQLKSLKRTGWLKRHIQGCESVAGHMYRMGIMAFFLDGKILNRERCIKMALVHDMAECIVGDITPFCGVSKEKKQEQEISAMDFLCSLVEEEIGKEILSLFMEYEEQQTVEAKSVKDLDKFDMLLQAYEYELEYGSCLDLQDFFDNTKGFQNKIVLNWFQDLQQCRSNYHESSFSEHKMPKSPLAETKNPETLLTDTKKPESLLPEPKKLESDVLSFFMLIGNLKHMKMMYRNLQEECESIADHVYLLSILVFLLDDVTSSGLNKDKCIKMALIQNITKGANKTSIFIHPEKVDEENMQIMEQMCKGIDEEVKKEFLDLLKEYQTQQTLEAKLVKELNEFEYLLLTHEREADLSKQICQSSMNLNFSFENSEVLRLAEELKILHKKRLISTYKNNPCNCPLCA